MRTGFRVKMLGLVLALFCLVPAGAQAVPVEWGNEIVYNTTGWSGTAFTGAPDSTYAGLGTGTVIYDFGVVGNAVGQDFNVYETASGLGEFMYLDIYVGVGTTWESANWYQVDTSQGVQIAFDGYPLYSSEFVRSYAIPEALEAINYVKLVGTGNGGWPIGHYNAGFDLNAVGIDPPVGVPEPATLLLLGSGLLGLGLVRRKKA